MGANDYTMLSARFGRSDGHKLSVYEAEGGYQALRKARGGMSPAEIRESVRPRSTQAVSAEYLKVYRELTASASRPRDR